MAENETTQEEVKRQIEGIEERHIALEEQLTVEKEAPRKRRLENDGRKQPKKASKKRRPENDGLTQLKQSTENRLKTRRSPQCIPTKQAEEAKELLENKRAIVIKGNPGEGKTTIALHLIDNEMYRDRRVVLYNPKNWEEVDTDCVDIIVLEDVFGRYDLDTGRLKEWRVYLPTIQEYVDVQKLQVIVTTRVDILSMAYTKLGSLKLFSDDFSLTLSSKQLTHSEKLSILNRELLRRNKTMKEEEKEKCISNFIGFIGFPQCCSLFSGDRKLFNRGPEFFRSPTQFFAENINTLDDTRFLSLAFLFCNGEICEEDLSPETMPESSKHLLMELASQLHISVKEASITLLRIAYNNLSELYVVRSVLDDISLGNSLKKPCIRFTHAIVSEAVGQVLSDRCLEMLVKYGDSGYLYQKTYTEECNDINSENVVIPLSLFGCLAKRMVLDVVNKGVVTSVVKHSALKQQKFLTKLKDEVCKHNRIKDFFMCFKYHLLSKDLLEGKCITFMQYILQSDEDIVKLVYNDFLLFLACTHDNNSPDCWQCKEKQTLLELALYYHHFEIVGKLLKMGACFTHVSLCNAARHGDFRKVEKILETLKRSQVFNPGCKEAKYALFRAQISGNQSLFELLLKERIVLDNFSLEDQQSSLPETDDFVEEDKIPEAGTVIPVEILRMDEESIRLYKEALQDGKEKVYNIRLMVVGQYGVGKTTLTKRLLGQQVDISERKSTEGIDIYKHCCKISLDTGEWTVQVKDSDQLSRLQRLMKLLPRTDQKPDVSQKQECHWEIIYQRETTSEKYNTNKNDTSACARPGKEVHLNSSQSVELPVNKLDERPGVEHSNQKTSNVAVPASETKSSESEKKEDILMEIIHLINENADKLEKGSEKYATLSMWDFAGQYVFYTTHQTFLTCHAIYLLVIDLSQQVTDTINDDEYYLDMEGIKPCKVHDSIEIWMNSIHSCAPSPEASIPNVILVGTHVDKLSEKSRKEAIETYFIQLRCMLREKPTIHHLMDDVAINNTLHDPMLEELKRNIFKLASQQPHWGVEKPARWLPLEQAIMTLRASGTKVVPLHLIEEINKSASVRIENRNELELFLRFHHEMGTILYFSVEGLREKIVLDPQLLIDALKTLFTAGTSIKKYPAITGKWYDFKETGKLTLELIDAVWTNNKELHDNRVHILPLMEKLHIIVKPRSYREDGKAVKEEDYYLAPFMLQQAVPKEIISPEPAPDMENTSVLCFKSMRNFLPPPVFHRLLGACLTHWPIANQNSKNLIYCGCCVFRLDLNHRLTVFYREHVIFARVTIMGITEKTQSFKLCIEVREFIIITLSNISGYLGQSLQFELFIKCPTSDGYSVNCLIPVADFQRSVDVPCHFHDNSHVITSHDVLKFWFQNEEHSDDELTPGSTRADSVYGNIPEEAKKKHKELISSLDGRIIVDSFRVIKRMAKTYLDRKTVDKAKDIKELLSHLEENGTLGVGQYDKLIEIMEDAGIKIGIDEIHMTTEHIKNIIQNSLPDQEQSETSSLDTHTSNQDDTQFITGTFGSANNYNVMPGKAVPIEAKRKHNKLCVTLAEHIEEDSLDSIKQLLSDAYLPIKTVYEIKEMDELLSHLEENGTVGVGKYDKLIEIMNDAGVQIGIEEIHKVARDIRDIMEKEQSKTSSVDAHTSDQDNIHFNRAVKEEILSEFNAIATTANAWW